MSSASRLRQLGYGAALFLVSAAALVMEIVAGRLLAPYVGMSLYSWTAIIAVVLAGLSVGHWIGGLLAAPGIDARRATRRVAAALAGAGLSSLAVLALLRLASGPLLAGIGHPILALVALAALLFLPPSLFAGIISPILTKLAVDEAPGHTGRVIGRMYALGTVGSIFGTLAAGYLFLSWIGSTGTVLAVAATYGALAVAFLSGTARGAAGAAAIALGLLVTQFGAASPCTRESDYYCLRVADFAPESGRPSTVLVLDHLGHGINDRDDPRLLYSAYLQFADELARHRFGSERIAAFFIGGGAYTLPRAWQAAYGERDILVAEIDPAVTRMAEDALWLRPADGLAVDHRDARVVLQGLERQPRFDVVFGDAFHDVSIPSHLVTREFHREIAARLKPDGFYAINVIESRRDPLFLLSLARTLGEDFPAVEIWIDADDQGAGERLTYLVVAGFRATDRPGFRASEGFERRWVRLRPDMVQARIAELRPPMLTDDFAPVDRLMAHVLLSPEVGER